MTRKLVALCASLGALALGPGTALAAPSPGPPPSPAGYGDTTAEQKFDQDADADASNNNRTYQSLTQNQGSSYSPGAGHFQAAYQSNKTDQDADADASNEVKGAVNAAVPVGNTGSGDTTAEQKFDQDADADASNNNRTYQSLTQNQGSSYSPGAGHFQAAYQSNKTDQDADADASNEVKGAVNAAVPVGNGAEYGKKGKDDYGKANGDTTAKQDFDQDADADAYNDNKTKQDLTQTQGSDYSPGAGHFQLGNQSNKTDQDADADASNEVKDPLNVALSIGNKGYGDTTAKQDFDQDADADAYNDNKTKQDLTQTQGSDYSPGAGHFQLGNQSNKTDQDADADASNEVKDPLNVALSIGNKGYGDTTAKQDFDQDADADAYNDNKTKQDLTQTQGSDYSPGAGHFQLGNQSNKTDQDADADASNEVKDPLNVALSIGNKGYGDTTAKQDFDQDADADAYNDNKTKQDLTQTQGSDYSPGAGHFQLGNQSNKTDQDADADASNEVKDPLNVALSIGNKGKDEKKGKDDYGKDNHEKKGKDDYEKGKEDEYGKKKEHYGKRKHYGGKRERSKKSYAPMPS